MESFLPYDERTAKAITDVGRRIVRRMAKRFLTKKLVKNLVFSKIIDIFAQMKQIKKRKATGVLAEMLKRITPESIEKTRLEMELEILSNENN